MCNNSEQRSEAIHKKIKQNFENEVYEMSKCTLHCSQKKKWLVPSGTAAYIPGVRSR